MPSLKNRAFRCVVYLLFFPAFCGCTGDGTEDPAPPPAEEYFRLTYIPFKDYAYVSTDLQPDKTFVLSHTEQVSECRIAPQGRNVPVTASGNDVLFRIVEAGQYVLYLNGFKVFLFVEEPERIPTDNVLDITAKGVDATGVRDETATIQAAIDEVAGTDKTLLFPAGTYRTSQLRIVNKNGVKMHLCRGAVLQAPVSTADQFSVTNLFGSPVESVREPGKTAGQARGFLVIDNSQNVRITGYGALNGNGYAQRVLATETYNGDSRGRHRNLLVTRSGDVTIEGIMSQDPGSWNTHVILSQRVTIRNVKLLNEVRYAPLRGNPTNENPNDINTDGFDPDSSSDVLIERCFGYCSDDNVAVKTSQYNNLLGNVDRVTVRGCVFLTRKTSLKVGTETAGAHMKGILFEDNDVVEADRGFSVYCYDGTDMEIVYRNNRIDRNYPDRDRCVIALEIKKRVSNYSAVGKARIGIENTTVYNRFPNASKIIYRQGTVPADLNVTISNLVVEGTRIVGIDSPKCPFAITGVSQGNPAYTIQ